MPEPAPLERVRLDKWLWAARFYKTRSLAARAVEGGKVKLNGARSKPSKALKTGDRLHINIGGYTWDVIVLKLSDQRGPASQARELYAEDEASRLKRQLQVAERRLQAHPGADLKGRPTKRARRQIHRFTQGN